MTESQNSPTNPNGRDVSITGDWPVGVRLGIRLNHMMDDGGYDQLPIHIPPGGYDE